MRIVTLDINQKYEKCHNPEFMRIVTPEVQKNLKIVTTRNSPMRIVTLEIQKNIKIVTTKNL